MKTDSYLREIRGCDGFGRAILTSIEVERASGKATFFITTDSVYGEDALSRLREISGRYLPEGFHADVCVRKQVADGGRVRDAILRIISKQAPGAVSFIRPQDVSVEAGRGAVRFCIDLSESEMAMLRKRVPDLVDRVASDLGKMFCGNFTGTLRQVEKPALGTQPAEDTEMPGEEPQEPIPARTFRIEGYTRIDGGETPETATCMADCNSEEDGLTVCGVIESVLEKQTSNGKPYFIFMLSDGTAGIRVTYFSKKATLEKVRALKEGDSVVCTGRNELYNGRLSYKAARINRGKKQDGYAVPEQPMRGAPASYRTVFPEPYSDTEQTGLFVREAPPDDLVKNDFVVFDLETTGLNNTGTGTMDSIIEVGAVKIRGGEICEKFSTFVAYAGKLPPEIVELTGIDDGMLVGAPEIRDVIPDFYKFCDGCSLVGHNVMFDWRFVDYYGRKERYTFAHRRYDTVTIAQKVLSLSNYKLNTVADYYGIKFNHHRAFDDALTTAKIFIELIRELGKLPDF